MRVPGLKRRDAGLDDAGRCRKIRLADFHVNNGPALRLQCAGARQNVHHLKRFDAGKAGGEMRHAAACNRNRKSRLANENPFTGVRDKTLNGWSASPKWSSTIAPVKSCVRV